MGLELDVTLRAELHEHGLGVLTGRDVTLLGVGIETLSVLPHLRAADVGAITMVEAAPISPDRQHLLDSHEVNVTDSMPTDSPVVLRSPGVPAHRDDVAQLCKQADLATTPTGLWLGVRGGSRTIVVTGTKGKSTTTTLIATGLEELGVDAQLVGNIGTSAWDVDPHFDGVAIAELSSYHGADLIATGEFGVLTMLADDHLDWHGSPQAYRHDKLRVFNVPQANGEPMEACFTPQTDVQLNVDVVGINVSGDYQTRNIALAVAAIRAELAKLSIADVPDVDTLTARLGGEYPHLPSRFEIVATHDLVTWIDDALASNPSATAAALERLRPGPTILIAGGHDRGVPLTPVVAELANWPAEQLQLIWLGASDDHRFIELRGLTAVGSATCVATMSDAVLEAHKHVGSAPVTALFSPLAPTERSIGVWSDRSRQFKEAVLSLSLEKGRSPTMWWQ